MNGGERRRFAGRDLSLHEDDMNDVHGEMAFWGGAGEFTAVGRGSLVIANSPADSPSLRVNANPRSMAMSF